tara:strand:+ start:2634 stop:2951 length:318 start_codon:yes stop_codon:yes gene_type:complete
MYELHITVWLENNCNCNHWFSFIYAGVCMVDDDPVNRPSHYTGTLYETIDIIEDTLSPTEFRGYCKGSTLKYIMRAERKGHPTQDLQKAQWFLDKLITYDRKRNN